MSNAKPPAKPKTPVPDPLPEPPDLAAKREQLLADLDKAAKASSGVLQQVLRKSHQLLSNTKPEGQLDEQLYQDVKDAFLRYSKDMAAPAAPPALMSFIEWLQAYVSARPPTIAPASGAAAAAAPAPAAAAAPTATPAAPAGARSPADGFESGRSRSHGLVTGEVPPPPSAGPLDPKKEQQQLESFKAWMKNPSFGKTKG